VDGLFLFKMKSTNFVISICSIVLCSVFPTSVFAYDTPTHGYLTREIIDFYNGSVSPEKEINDGYANFLIDGSLHEDTPPRWMNHFYDPVFNRGLSYDLAIDPLINLGTWEKSKDWANDSLHQKNPFYTQFAGVSSILSALQKQKLNNSIDERDFTWDRALQLYISGENEKAMYALGHILHLLEDASVPDHTRNDPHPADSPYENFTSKFTLTNADPTIRHLLENKQPAHYADLQTYFQEMAIYTNSNFYSVDTIGIQSGYNNPQPDYFSQENYASQLAMKTDSEFGDYPLAREIKLFGFWPTQSINRDEIMAAYWSRLSTKNVQTGAGLIVFFLEEAERLKNDGFFMNKKEPSFLAATFNLSISFLNNLGRSLREFFFGMNTFLGSFGEAYNDDFSTEDNGKSFPVAVLPSTNSSGDVRATDKIVLPTASASSSQVDHLSTSSNEFATGTDHLPPISTSSEKSVQGEFTIVINEIMYDPPANDEKREWIELYHASGDPVDVTSLFLYESGTRHRIKLAHGKTILENNQYAVLADDAEEFLKANPSFSGNLFEVSMSLSNSGEKIEIKKDNFSYDSYTYFSSLGGDGNNFSLQRFMEGWEASVPTPGRQNIKTLISNSGGGSLEEQKLPQAQFSFEPLLPVLGEDVFFSAASSTAPTGEIIGYQWSFGDGSNYYSTSTYYARHAYFAEGDYQVSLLVTDKSNQNHSTSTSIHISTSSDFASIASAVVISEVLFNPEGSDEGREFIEFYNPQETAIDLNKWSLRYQLSGSTTSVSLTSFNSENGDKTIIPSKGFLLVGLNGYDASFYEERIADVMRSRSLPNGGLEVKIFLQDEEGVVRDAMNYSQVSIDEEGQSLERKAIWGGFCVSPKDEAEYLGNSCDNGRNSDFTIRDKPLPQNSQSLPEPRPRPETPQPVGGKSKIGEFVSSTMSLVFQWEAVSPNVSGTLINYEISEATSSPSIPIVKTSNSTGTIAILEVGRSYNIRIIAEDAEGYSSLPRIETIDVARFIDRLEIYRDPRPGNEGKYLLDLYYSSFPFIPSVYGRNAWQGIVVYKNQDPDPASTLLDSQNEFRVEAGNNVVKFNYSQCSGGITGNSEESLIFPLAPEWCSVGGGLHSNALNFGELEDLHLQMFLSNTNMQIGDYFTVAFYDFSFSGGDRQELTLVGIDKNKNYFAESPSFQHAPVLEGGLSVTFVASSSDITLNLPQVTDKDTLDKNIVFISNYSPLNEGLKEELWSSLEISKSVSIGDKYMIGVRAKDDLDNYSEIATTTWVYPTTTVVISQIENTGWSTEFGTVVHSLEEPNSASFQSFTPQNSFSFDFVALKLWQEIASNHTNLRLSVFGALPDGNPDFSNSLGEANLQLSLPEPQDDQVFTFSNPIEVEANKMYWLVVDVSYYYDSDSGYFYFRNKWKNAIANDFYPYGAAGRGYAPGRHEALPNMYRFDGNYPFGPADWYFKIGKRLSP
jgi:hypothetical protein